MYLKYIYSHVHWTRDCYGHQFLHGYYRIYVILQIFHFSKFIHWEALNIIWLTYTSVKLELRVSRYEIGYQIFYQLWDVMMITFDMNWSLLQ